VGDGTRFREDEESMQVKLKVSSGSHEGREIAISSEKFLIGRSDVCQLRPKSESVSRKHCIIVLKEGRVLIQDLKSRNGTYVNDQRLPADKAKVLKSEDQLRIGKLEFQILIEHGLQGAKKPQVADVSDAAARTVQAGADSKFEEVDVTSWLDEADQIDRVRKLSDPETRQFRLGDDSDSNSESGELSVSDSSAGSHQSDEPKSSDDLSHSGEKENEKIARLKRKKQPPGKLPANMKREIADSSRDAADNALRRFFSGQ
jgi:pSer/pThr/pTyr-binding forkhead associated (FHA) protein